MGLRRGGRIPRLRPHYVLLCPKWACDAEPSMAQYNSCLPRATPYNARHLLWGAEPMLRRLGLLAVVLFLSIPELAQDQAGVYPVRPDYPVLDDLTLHSPGAPVLSPQEQRMRRQAQLQLAQHRMHRLHDEAQELVTLANQLKAELDTSGNQALSVEAIKKAQQIEKLAKNMRKNMKGE